MNSHLHVSFGPVDRLNLDCGYQLRIENVVNGAVLLFTSVNPSTGKPLLSASDCTEVVGWYAR